MSVKLKSFTILFVLMNAFDSYNYQSNDDYSDCFGYCSHRFTRIRSRYKYRKLIRGCVEDCEQYYYEEDYPEYQQMYNTPEYKQLSIYDIRSRAKQKTDFRPQIDLKPKLDTKQTVVKEKVDPFDDNQESADTMLKQSSSKDNKDDKNNKDNIDNTEIPSFLSEYAKKKEYFRGMARARFEERKNQLTDFFDKDLPKKETTSLASLALKSVPKFSKIVQPSHCGYKSKKDQLKSAITGLGGRGMERIVGGTDADPHEFPWMVSFLYKTKNKTESHFCGGAIISDRWLLTAAHCLDRYLNKEKLLIIKIGINAPKAESTQSITAEKIYVHDGWDSTTQLNDISIVKTKETIKFTTDNLGRYKVNMVCLPETPTEPEGFSVLAGWGERVFQSNIPSEWLEKVTVPIVERNKCHTIYKNYLDKYFKDSKVKVEESHVCAGGVGGEDGCRGDSGGPLVQVRNRKAYHLGIVSFSIPCAIKGIPTIYSNTIYFMNWIQQKIKN